MLTCLQLKEFVIIGRKLPTEDTPSPSLFKMTIFAPNDVVAKSRFWYFLSQLKKVKKMAGEVISITQIHESSSTSSIKNYAVWYVWLLYFLLDEPLADELQAALRLTLRYTQHVPRVPRHVSCWRDHSVLFVFGEGMCDSRLCVS